jgi:malate dehydrogenase
MGFIAIVGCGALGGAVAHKVAGRDRVAEVRLVDPEGRIAQGKALDILQSAPIEQFSTRVSAATDWNAVAGAEVIVIADDGRTGQEHAGEAGLAMLRQIAKVAGVTPIVFAGAAQRELIGRSAGELNINRPRLIGSAPLALEAAVRAIVAVLLDSSGVEVALRVFGVPPGAAVVAWEEATAAGLPLSAQLPAHQIAAIDARLRSLWPPGPYALASAAARVVEALVGRSRRSFSCFVPLERGPLRGAVVAMPVELGLGGTKRVIEPVLSRQELTRLENAIEM